MRTCVEAGWHPPVLTTVTGDMDESRHEVFGPVSKVSVFNGWEEGCVNSTSSRLSAYENTRDLAAH